MKTKTAYALSTKTTALGESLHLNVYDIIGDFWAGGDGNTTALGVAALLEQNQTATEIHGRINSLGGILDEAHAIRARLVSHPAKVIIDIDGVAASAATVIMSAGNIVRIGRPCAIMIHEARSGMRNATEGDYLARAAELKVANEGIAQLYAAMSAARGKNVSAEQFRQMMAKETWFSAQEALDAGLVDEIVDAIPEALVAQVDLSECKAVPGWVAQRFAASSAPVAVAAPTTAQRAPTPAPNAGEDPMKFAAVLALLGITDAMDEQAALATARRLKDDATSASGTVAKLESLTGASGDAALVLVSGWKNAAAELAQAKVDLENEKKANEQKEHDALVAKLDNEGKIDSDLRDWCSTQTLAQLQDWAKRAKRIIPGDPNVGTENSRTRETDPTSMALTEQEKADAKSMGMTEEAYLANKKLVREKYPQ